MGVHSSNTFFNVDSPNLNYFRRLNQMHLNDSLKTLPGIGESSLLKLEKLAIATIHDLLYYFPRTYQDTRLISKISELTERDKKYSIFAEVSEIRNIRIRNGKSIQKATLVDDSDSISVTWFNQSFLTKTLKEGSQGYFSGKLSNKSLLPELMSPTFDLANNNQINIGRIVPTYQLTSGITPKWLRKIIYELIHCLDLITDLKDQLPETIIQKYSLTDLKSSLTEVHFPETKQGLIEARKRLAFDELLTIQSKLLTRRNERQLNKAPKVKIKPEIESNFYASLPFDLTASQKQAIQDIEQDFGLGHPMTRLIQGDVGSGKTVVSFSAALTILNSGYQAVLLAPTSVLAEQHYQLALSLMPKKYKIALITSDSAKHISKLPKVDFIIGTHAILFHQKELLHKLGLIIIDEEHRFGVKQRNALSDFTNKLIVKPHYLSLTATPIPRSIALSLFGDMDVSKIEKPEQRKPIKTLLVPPHKRQDSMDWIAKKLTEGGQAFWICPLIDDNPEMDAQSVEKLYKELIKIYEKKDVIFLHGKMKTKEKNSILQDIKAKKYKILVSTTVIEVGIDIPDANLIIIEDAERFGLAQLHQLRGRVGRKNQEAWCLLFSNLQGSIDTVARLKFFTSETDGNKIAEFDLQSRGPGEVYGTVQSGIPDLKIARFSNSEILLQTREAAEYIFNLNNNKL